MDKSTHRHPSKLVIPLTSLALAGFIAWSSFAEIDQVSRATGQVIPSGRVQIVQSTDGGVIEKIHVKEGDQVTKGQVLVCPSKDKKLGGGSCDRDGELVCAIMRCCGRTAKPS